MKKLLTLMPAALIPLFVWSCGFHKPADVAKEVVQEQAADLQERFDALPRTIPLTKQAAPDYSVPQRRAPVVKPKAPVKPHTIKRPAVKAPVPLPPPPPKQEEELPPQSGVICIFPFNLIPSCTPEPAGRLP